MRAAKYRIYPDKNQKELLEQHFGHTRHIYNWALSEKKKHYEETGKSLSKRELQDRMVASKKSEKPWLNDINSQSLLAALNNIDTAFSNFFKKRAKFPKFKKKYASGQSFQCPQHVTLDVQNGVINLPKIKSIKSVIHRVIKGKIKTVTIKKSPSGKYYASILFDDGFMSPIPETIRPEKSIGIDLGLSHAFILSSGYKENNPRFLNSELPKLRVAQKILSRKKIRSSKRKKQKKKVAVIHERISQKREAFLHEKTTELVIKSQVTSFVVEDLNIKGMTKNRKLSRHINDVSWGNFIRILKYKSEWHGKNVITVNRFFASSKTCHSCHYKMDEMPLSIRHWLCPECGKEHDRDINAAINICHQGLADSLGHSDYVKSSLVARSVSADATTKAIGIS